MNCLTACINYDDFLAVTLPLNRRFFDRMVVVTCGGDDRTKSLLKSFSDVEVFVTEAFFYLGHRFNRGRAFEEALDFLGREGWICLMDADIVLPDKACFMGVKKGFLYSAKRRDLQEFSSLEGLDWSKLPYGVGGAPSCYGYLQVFHARDSVLVSRPWIPLEHPNVNGSDDFFMRKWSVERRKNLPFEVLHLGEEMVNWRGRASPRWIEVNL